MNPRYTWLAILIFILPNLAAAESEPPTGNWTIGYEQGVTLRRFMGDSWEIWLGGGPNDQKSDYTTERWQPSAPDTFEIYSVSLDESKSESGHIQLGVGRCVLRDDPFWVTATLSVDYDWDNFQTRFGGAVPYREEINQRVTVGHEMITRAELGLRPAYNLTSRIVLMVEFGLYFQHNTRTWDEDNVRINGTDLYHTRERRNRTSDRIGLYGYYGLDSISFMFRF